MRFSAGKDYNKTADRHGDYVRDLGENELEVYEDGKLRKIDFFAVTDQAALSRPLAVVFALVKTAPFAASSS